MPFKQLSRGANVTAPLFFPALWDGRPFRSLSRPRLRPDTTWTGANVIKLFVSVIYGFAH